ncbi:MAG TPA: hypothetical protein VI912_03215 [Candidatus Bilamarchaeaceae archaeon]|nr:hypothetical protein [Candidatus Bilamarchaeaceae archaeon]
MKINPYKIFLILISLVVFVYFTVPIFKNIDNTELKASDVNKKGLEDDERIVIETAIVGFISIPIYLMIFTKILRISGQNFRILTKGKITVLDIVFFCGIVLGADVIKEYNIFPQFSIHSITLFLSMIYVIYLPVFGRMIYKEQPMELNGEKDKIAGYVFLIISLSYAIIMYLFNNTTLYTQMESTILISIALISQIILLIISMYMIAVTKREQIASVK